MLHRGKMRGTQISGEVHRKQVVDAGAWLNSWWEPRSRAGVGVGSSEGRMGQAGDTLGLVPHCKNTLLKHT